MVLIYSNSPRLVFLYPAAFCSTQNGIPSCFSSDSLFLFLFHGTEFRIVLLPRKGSERNSERFLFRGTAGIQSEMIICCVYSVFHRIIFLSEITNPSHYYLLLVFPSVLMSLLLLVYPAVPVFS